MGNNSKIVSAIDAPSVATLRAQEITEADKIGTEVRGIMLHTNEERGREGRGEVEKGKDGLMGIERKEGGTMALH